MFCRILAVLPVLLSVPALEAAPAAAPKEPVPQKIYLWKDAGIRGQYHRPSITMRLLPSQQPRPAILVIPGGAYAGVATKTEGTPIAGKFNELGYQTFVLYYRTNPSLWPAPQIDAMRAMKMIRAHAREWNVDPDRIAVCGFSAGGHLAGSLGILCDGLDASAGDECDAFSHRPNAMILCYGVLSFAPWSHEPSQRKLLGDGYEPKRMDYSLPEHVTKNTPPAFLMHTIQDQLVPYRNSIEFAAAMAKAGRPCELMLCHWGKHGMLLGKNTQDVGLWPEMADRFLKALEESKRDPNFAERYTNAYQAKQCR